MLNANSVLVFTDPDEAGLVYDFTSGAVGLMVGSEVAATNAAAAEATATGAANDATVTAVDNTAPPPDDEPTHSGASSIQWSRTSMSRPQALTVPQIRVASKKPTVLVDVDEEELFALGVL